MVAKCQICVWASNYFSSDSAVESVRAELLSTGQIAQFKKTVGKDGKARRKPKRKHIPTQHIPEEADNTFTLETAKLIRSERSAEKRAEATNSRERNDDGTLASGATTCGTTGKKNRTTDTKATASGVDRGTVERNEWLAKHRPDLHGKVRTGELTSSKARNIAKKETRAADLEKQRAEIEAGTAELPVGVFEVVVIDPPWAYPGGYDPVGNRSAIPYPPMEQNELSALIPPLADDAVMFLWTTHQFIWDAKDLLDQWGLDYKATLVWDKEKIGMGRWFRMQSEFCVG